MATPTLYRSTDASAPVLTGEAGKLIDLLDAILVDGYGSKSAAGWTKPYSGTNKAVYRNSGTETFVRVVDDNSNFGSLAVAEVFGFASMTDVDTGTGQFPTASNITSDPTQRKHITKSVTTDSTPRKWAAAATDRTLILCIEHGTNDARSSWVYFVGDYETFVPSDSNNFALLASNWEESASPSSNSIFFGPYTFEDNSLSAANDIHSYYGAIKQTASSSDVVGPNASLITIRIADDGTTMTPGSASYDAPPHPIYGYPLSEVFIIDEEAAIVRGRVPGLMFANCSLDDDASGLNNFQTLTINDPDEGALTYLYAGLSTIGRWNPTTACNGYLIEIGKDNWP